MSSRPRRASSRPAAVAAAAASAPAATVEATPSKRKGAAAASARKRRRTDKEEEEGQEDTNEETDGDVEEEGESDTPDAPMSDVILPSESTPAKRSTAAAGNSPTSPAFEPQFAQPLLRTKRLEEKNELQELNKRLELYILRQRERDANQGGLNHEIQILKEKFKTELESEKKRHDTRYEELKKQKFDLSSQLQELQDAHDKLSHQAKDHLASSNLYKARCAELEKRLKKVEQELEEVKKRNIELENQVKKLQIDYAEENEAHLLLKEQLDTQKSALTLAQKQLNVIQSKANTYLQDLEALQASSQEEQSLLNKQLSILRAENQGIEEELRKEFGSQLKNLLRERQEQAEQEREEQMARLKEFYETTLSEKNSIMTSQASEIDRIQRLANTSAKELEAERKSNASAAAIRADYERQIAKLHEVAEQQRERFETQLITKTDQIARAQTIITQKETEFQQLMDVKIALDMEIAQYNSLLGTEESRLGFEPAPSVVTPHKARLSLGGGGAKSARKSTTTTTTTTSTLFSSASSSRRQSIVSAAADSLSVSVNPSNRKITLSNLASYDPADPEAGSISVKGFVVVAVGSNQSCAVEAKVLPPGGSITIVTPSGRVPSGNGNNLVQRWNIEEEASIWQNGETIQIKDGRGNVIDTVHIRV